MRYKLETARPVLGDSVNVEIPRALHTRAKLFAFERGVRLSAVVAVALGDYLNQRAAAQDRGGMLPLLAASTRK